MTDASGEVVDFSSAGVVKTGTEKRQVTVETAAMTDAAGNVIEFNPAGVVKTGTEKRQVTVETAAMTDAAGNVIEFNPAGVVKTGTEKRQVTVETAAMTDASGNVVGFNSAAVVKSKSPHLTPVHQSIRQLTQNSRPNSISRHQHHSETKQQRSQHTCLHTLVDNVKISDGYVILFFQNKRRSWIGVGILGCFLYIEGH